MATSKTKTLILARAETEAAFKKGKRIDIKATQVLSCPVISFMIV
jgi:hypothetical protein